MLLSQQLPVQMSGCGPSVYTSLSSTAPSSMEELVMYEGAKELESQSTVPGHYCDTIWTLSIWP